MAKVKTIIRRWGDSKELIALFPEIPAGPTGRTCESYTSRGQFGAADYDHVIAHSERMWWIGPEEQAFLEELARHGRQVELRFRQTDAMAGTRWRSAQRPS